MNFPGNGAADADRGESRQSELWLDQRETPDIFP
jgi:hypothetical protein